jgi:hypothetical protein
MEPQTSTIFDLTIGDLLADDPGQIVYLKIRIANRRLQILNLPTRILLATMLAPRR